MKKMIAMILALTTASSLAVTAMAETTTPEAAGVDTISFGRNEDGLSLSDSLVLTPGETYYFPVKYTAQGETEAKDMTLEQYKNLKFHFANEEGKRAIDSMKVEKHKGVYSLSIETKKGWPTELTEVLYDVNVVDSKDSSKEINAESLSFQVGYNQIPENALKNPDYVLVDESAPVITEDNFESLNDLADGKEVTFANGDWEFAVRVKGLKDLNMLNNQDDIDEIIEKYENQEFKFVSFPAGPEFRTTGTLTIDVSGEMEEYEGGFVVYRYLNGKLTKMESSLNEEDEKLVVKTKQLGRFVITNKEIKDRTVVDNTNSGESGSGSQNNGGSGEKNPSTGAGDAAGLAVAMAVVAAAGLAAASKKVK